MEQTTYSIEIDHEGRRITAIDSLGNTINVRTSDTSLYSYPIASIRELTALLLISGGEFSYEIDLNNKIGLVFKSSDTMMILFLNQVLENTITEGQEIKFSDLHRILELITQTRKNFTLEIRMKSTYWAIQASITNKNTLTNIMNLLSFYDIEVRDDESKQKLLRQILTSIGRQNGHTPINITFYLRRDPDDEDWQTLRVSTIDQLESVQGRI